jgi:hypothetical protein
MNEQSLQLKNFIIKKNVDLFGMTDVNRIICLSWEYNEASDRYMRCNVYCTEYL